MSIYPHTRLIATTVLCTASSLRPRISTFTALIATAPGVLIPGPVMVSELAVSSSPSLFLWWTTGFTKLYKTDTQKMLPGILHVRFMTCCMLYSLLPPASAEFSTKNRSSLAGYLNSQASLQHDTATKQDLERRIKAITVEINKRYSDANEITMNR